MNKNSINPVTIRPPASRPNEKALTLARMHVGIGGIQHKYLSVAIADPHAPDPEEGLQFTCLDEDDFISAGSPVSWW